MHLFWEPIIEPSLSIIKPKHIVEIGSENGYNTKKIIGYCGGNKAKAYIIDPNPNYDVNAWQQECGGVAEFYVSLSLDALPKIKKKDVVLIDGDHNWYTVYNELKLIGPVAGKPTPKFPLVFLHDVNWPYARRDLYYAPETIPPAHRKPYKSLGMKPDVAELLEKGGLNASAKYNNAIRENDPQSGVLTAVEDFIAESPLNLRFVKLPVLTGLGILFPDKLLEQNPAFKDFIDKITLSPFLDQLLALVERQRIDMLLDRDEKRADLNEYYVKSKNEIQVLVSKLGERKKRNEEDVQSIKDLQGGLDALRTELARNAEVLSQSQRAQDELREMNEASQRLVEEKQALLQSLRQELEQKDANLEATRAQRQQAEGELKELRERLGQRELTLADQARELERQAATLAQAQEWNALLETEIAHLEGQVGQQQAALQESGSKLARLREELDKTLAQRERLEDDLRSMRSHAQGQQEELRAANDRLGEIEKRLIAAEAGEARKHEESLRTQTCLEALSRELAELRQSLRRPQELEARTLKAGEENMLGETERRNGRNASKDQEEQRNEVDHIQQLLREQSANLFAMERQFYNFQNFLASVEEHVSGRRERGRAALLALLKHEAESRAREIRQLIRWFEQLHQYSQWLLGTRRWRVGHVLVRCAERLMFKPCLSKTPGLIGELDRKYRKWKADYERRVRDTFSGGDPVNLKTLEEKNLCLLNEIRLRTGEVGKLSQWIEQLDQYVGGLAAAWRWRIGQLLLGLPARVFTAPLSTPATLHGAQIIVRFNEWKMIHKPAEIAFEFEKLLARCEIKDDVRLATDLNNARNALSQPVPVKNHKPLQAPERIRTEPAVAAAAGLARACAREQIVITQFTPPSPRNPYYTMISEQLKRVGWNYDFIVDRAQLLEKVRQSGPTRQIVHFHQLDPFYTSKTRDRAEIEAKARELVGFLAQLKQAGAHLVWTRHNPRPHDPFYAQIDTQLVKEIAPLLSRIIVHGKQARRFLKRDIDVGKVVVVPHPSYRDCYGPAVPRDEARRQLGLDPDLFIFGNIGEIKPYKGHELIVEAFSKCQREANDGNGMALLLAGKEGPADYIRDLTQLCQGNIILRPGNIRDEDMPLWLGAIDAAVFAFNNIFVSGSTLLAMTYQIPVIVPDLGCLPEYVLNEISGFVYKAGDAEDLCRTMRKVRHSPLLSHIRYMCGVFREKNAAANIAQEYADLYLSVANEH